MEKISQAKTGTVQLIPLDMIQTEAQVRTRFNEESITELAADIRKRGVLQPLVVQGNGDGRFTLLIGERRLRAIRLAGGTHAPALLAQVADADREEIQLIENIQREDLGAKDLLHAIEKLYRKHRSVSTVARIVHKSTAWVSKKVATALKMGPLTMQIVEADIKDTEMLYAFATLEKADKAAALTILPEVLDGTARRKDVQAALKAVISGNVAEPDQDDKTGDLFADQAQETAPPCPKQDAELREKLQIALDALEKISNTPAAMNPMQKWEMARDTAREAIQNMEKVSQAKT